MRTRRAPRAELTRLPVLATPRSVALNTAVLFLGAGLLTLVTTVLPGGPAAGVVPVRLLAAAAVAVGVGLVVAGARLPRWGFHLVQLTGWAMVTEGVLVSGGDAVSFSYALYYLLQVVNAIAACSWTGAAAHLLVGLVCTLVVIPARSVAEPAEAAVLAGVLVLLCAYVGRAVRAAAAAEVDALTGLVNRRGLDRHLDQVLEQGSRSDAGLALAVMDLDHFKDVNDLCGHAAGDRLLRTVAASWSALLPPDALLARAGGDEFVLLAGGSDAVVELVERLREALPPGQTCSAGTARWHPGESASELVSRADSALYRAKRTSRGTTVPHEADAADAREAVALLGPAPRSAGR